MNPIYRRLVVVSAVGLVALLLLVLKNWVDTGYQEFQIELREVPAATSAPADDAKTYRVVLKDVAGLPKDLDTEAAWKVLETELTHRLGARDGEKAIPMVEVPRWNSDKTVTLRPAKEVHFTELRSRLSGRPVSYANPARELAHMNRGIDIRGGVEFICHLRNQQGENVAATDEVMAILRSRLDERGLTEPTVTRMSNGDLQVVIPGGTKADAARTRKVLESSGRLEFREVLWPNADHSQMTIEGRPSMPGSQIIELGNGRYGQAPGSKFYLGREDLLAPKEPELGEPPSTFYRLGPVRMTGLDVSDAGSTMHQGQLAVSIAFTAVGAGKNEEFTRALFNQDKERGGQGTGTLAILFDGVVKSAAHVTSPSSASCIIYGRFTQDEIDSLRSTLKGGSLSVTPEVLSERVVGASLGEDAINRTVVIRVVAILAMVAFMWVYYRRLGTVANLCLLCTALLIVATLSIFDATITLPGLAGLVLIIGMAVDTNILIFERIREELKEDKGLKAAIEAGYDRAFLTIIDSHLTTFATAFILFLIGTGPVKGFGLTLMIGIVVNLFSGVYIGRLLTDWLCRNQTTLTMASWVPALRLNYVKGRWFAYYFSIITAVAGLFWFSAGHLVMGTTFERNFDIDFTGGSMVQVTFKEAKDLGQIEQSVKATYSALPGDQQKSSLINPHELRIQAYYSEFGAATASRQWTFRVRDDEGSALEAKRRLLEEKNAAIRRETEVLRQQPDSKQAVKAKLVEQQPVEAEIAQLGQQISRRTEVFKEQLAKAFPGQIAAEGEEIIEASLTGQSLAFRLATLNPPNATSVEELVRKLSRFAEVSIRAQDSSLAVTVAYKAPPVAKSGPLDDPQALRFATLLLPSAGADAPTVAQVASELAHKITDVAAGLNITVVRPFPASEHFSGQVADQMKLSALVALILSLAAIMAYIAARFEFRFGIGAVVALVHDVLMTIGLITALGFRIDLTVVAALLTIIGASINETIIIYDRIRENLRRLNLPLAEIIDLSVAQTMARTTLTSGTVLTTLVVLLIFGGDALRPFTATLLIGMLSGLYSSIFVAAPLLLSFKGRVIVPVVERPEDTGPDPSQGILAKPTNP